MQGFRGDAHPVRELTGWLKLAAVYHEMTHAGKDPAAIADEFFAILVASMNNGGHALETVRLSRISKARSESIVERLQNYPAENVVRFWNGHIDLHAHHRMLKEEAAKP